MTNQELKQLCKSLGIVFTKSIDVLSKILFILDKSKMFYNKDLNIDKLLRKFDFDETIKKYKDDITKTDITDSDHLKEFNQYLINLLKNDSRIKDYIKELESKSSLSDDDRSILDYLRKIVN